MKAGDYPAACAKFEASSKIEPSVGALLNLGRCRDKNGQTASAWTIYRQAASLARQLGDKRREKVANRNATKLEGKLSYLTIEVPDDVRVDGLAVTRNGDEVEEALWNHRVPIDPGEYAIQAQAPNHKPNVVQIEVPPEGGNVSIILSSLKPEASVKPPTDSEPDQSPPPTIDLDDRSAPTTTGRMPIGRKVAIGVASTGVVGLAVGVVFALRSQAKWDDAKPFCDENNACAEEGVTLAEQASDAAQISNISYVVGGIAVAGAVALWFLSSAKKRPAREAGASKEAARLLPLLGPNSGGFAVEWNY